jgi:hypothetical protein
MKTLQSAFLSQPLYRLKTFGTNARQESGFDCVTFTSLPVIVQFVTMATEADGTICTVFQCTSVTAVQILNGGTGIGNCKKYNHSKTTVLKYCN